MAIRALIFDLDGLLLDTESSAYTSWASVYRDHGHVLPRDHWVAAIGTIGRFDALAHLAALVGEGFEAEAARCERLRRHHATIAQLGPMAGVPERLEEAGLRGLRRAVASSSPRSWVEGHLSRIGLREHFDALRCSDDVARVKPEPDLYLAAAGALGVAPHEAVAFEDSANGVAAARAAGLYCVAVPGPMTRGQGFEKAHRVVSSLAELTVAEIVAEASARPARPTRGAASRSSAAPSGSTTRR